MLCCNIPNNNSLNLLLYLVATHGLWIRIFLFDFIDWPNRYITHSEIGIPILLILTIYALLFYFYYLQTYELSHQSIKLRIEGNVQLLHLDNYSSEMRDIYPNNIWLQFKTSIVLTVHFGKYHLMCICNCINTYTDVCDDDLITILCITSTMFFIIIYIYQLLCWRKT